MEITKDLEHVKVFPELDDALVWVEEQILGVDGKAREQQSLLDLHEMEVFKGRRKETIAALETGMQLQSYKEGEKIYSPGDNGDRLFLIRRGAVRIVLPLEGAPGHHLATYGRGDFFGGLSFLDGQPRTNEAIACADTDLFVLPREAFDKLGEEHKKLALNLIEAIARVLGDRLRYDDMELAALRN